jgi:GTP pyrophosphokinase
LNREVYALKKFAFSDFFVIINKKLFSVCSFLKFHILIAVKEVREMILFDSLDTKIGYFLEKIKKSALDKIGKEMVAEALFFAVDAHAGDTRLSGEEFVLHPIAVAELLLEIDQTAEVVAAALLHDVVEDTRIPLFNIEEKFGKEVSFLVDGMTKVFSSCHIDKIEDIFGPQVAFAVRKMIGSRNISFVDRDIVYRAKIITFARGDYRVIYIRLADRVHNLRTVKSLPISKQRSVAQETLEFHIPLAREFIPKIKLKRIDPWLRELNSLANQCLNPEIWKSTARRGNKTCLSAM